MIGYHSSTLLSSEKCRRVANPGFLPRWEGRGFQVATGLVIPAKAGIHRTWVRAFAGTTHVGEQQCPNTSVGPRLRGDDSDFYLVGWAGGPWQLLGITAKTGFHTGSSTASWSFCISLGWLVRLCRIPGRLRLPPDQRDPKCTSSRRRSETAATTECAGTYVAGYS